MVTNNPLHKANRVGLLENDRIRTLDRHRSGCWHTGAKSIESAMKSGRSKDVRPACAEFLDAASTFYKVHACGVRVLAARPLRVRERWTANPSETKMYPSGFAFGRSLRGEICGQSWYWH